MNPFSLVPAQPTSPDPNAQNAWMAAMNGAFSEWASRYVAELGRRGFAVTVIDTNDTGTPIYSTGKYYVYSLAKSNVSIERLVTFGVATQADPESQAAADEANLWGYAYAQSTGVNPYTAGSPLGPAVSAGPSTTSPAGNTSSQPAQTPSNPDSGTVTSNSGGGTPTGGSEVKHGFDAWNYLYWQETGREGPAPEEVGVTQRDTPITQAQWWSIVSAWYAGASSGAGSSSGSGSSSGTGTGSGSTGSGTGSGSGSGTGSGSGSGGSGSGGTGSTGNPPAAGMSTEKMLMIGAVVLAGVLFFKK